jgi:hypothetical protein
MEIIRLIVLHLVIGVTIVTGLAAWVAARWAALQLWNRIQRPPLAVAFPKMAPAKPFRVPVRDLLLQSAD